MPSTDFTPAQTEALRIAHTLVDAGVPVFCAARNSSLPDNHRMPFLLPSGWQDWKPNHGAVDRWRPGMALAAVCGVAMDALDVDLQHDGLTGMAEMQAAGIWPESFGTARTASGGTHHLIARTQLPKQDPIQGIQGVDLQAGAPGGNGRGFIFIAPTVKFSKTTGEMTEYRWEVEPDLAALKASEPSEAHRKLRNWVAAPKGKQKASTPAAATTPSAPAPSGEDFWDSAEDSWTWQQAEADIERSLKAMEAARAGEVNTTVGGLARRIGRFVAGGYLAEEEAARAIMAAVKRGGVHSDEWNTANGVGWTLTTLIGKAFEKAGEDAPFVVPDKPALDRESMTDAERAQWEDSARHFPTVYADAAILAGREKAKTRERMEDSFLDLDALENMPATKPLIKGVLDLESASWLIGQSGGFKSFVAIDWACHIAAGLPDWRGRKVTPGDVLYVAGEGARGVAKRVRAWTQHTEKRPEGLKVRPMPVRAMGETPRHLSDDWRALVEYAGAVKPALIVLDTQARMATGLEENSAKEMGLFVEAVDALKVASGACVLVVHHTGRTDGDARGSTAIDGAQDGEWKVSRKKNDLRVKLACEKSKDGNENQSFAFDMEVVVTGQDEDGEDITSLVLGEQSDDDRVSVAGVVEDLKANAEGLTARQKILMVLKVVEVERKGMSAAGLRRAVNEALKEAGEEAMSPNTFDSTKRRMVQTGDLFLRGEKVSAWDPASDAQARAPRTDDLDEFVDMAD
jgi:hypothetical protein